jgi:hypothetical protein
MGLSKNEVRILALHTSGATRAALEAIAGGGQGNGETSERQLRNGRHAHKRGQVSGSEQRYYDAYLWPRLLIGELVEVTHENERISLGHNAAYSPDWVCTLADGSVEYHEVKGSGPADRDRDTRTRWKWAASLNPLSRFVWAKEIDRKGTFKVEVYER